MFARSTVCGAAGFAPYSKRVDLASYREWVTAFRGSSSPPLWGNPCCPINTKYMRNNVDTIPTTMKSMIKITKDFIVIVTTLIV